MASPDPPGPTTMSEARTAVGGRVRIVGVIGSPVAHSLSPLLHNTAFAALGLADRWRSFAFEVPVGAVETALELMRGEDITGLSVTMPHKAEVEARVEECADVARRLHAVNCIHNRDGRLFGTNTDGQGFLDSLGRGADFDPTRRRCLVIGAGGAARAVILALAQAGATEVVVLNRTPHRASEAAALAGRLGSVAGGDVAAAVERADLVVNATPVGMVGVAPRGEDPLVPPGLLRTGQVAVDLVYAPRPTAWLRAAAASGARTVDGLGMLVHQAADQLSLWTGQAAPVEAMWHAAEQASPIATADQSDDGGAGGASSAGHRSA